MVAKARLTGAIHASSAGSPLFVAQAHTGAAMVWDNMKPPRAKLLLLIAGVICERALAFEDAADAGVVSQSLAPCNNSGRRGIHARHRACRRYGDHAAAQAQSSCGTADRGTRSEAIHIAQPVAARRRVTTFGF